MTGPAPIIAVDVEPVSSLLERLPTIPGPKVVYVASHGVKKHFIQDGLFKLPMEGVAKGLVAADARVMVFDFCYSGWMVRYSPSERAFMASSCRLSEVCWATSLTASMHYLFTTSICENATQPMQEAQEAVENWINWYTRRRGLSYQTPRYKHAVEAAQLSLQQLILRLQDDTATVLDVSESSPSSPPPATSSAASASATPSSSSATPVAAGAASLRFSASNMSASPEMTRITERDVQALAESWLEAILEQNPELLCHPRGGGPLRHPGDVEYLESTRSVKTARFADRRRVVRNVLLVLAVAYPLHPACQHLLQPKVFAAREADSKSTCLCASGGDGGEDDDDAADETASWIDDVFAGRFFSSQAAPSGGLISQAVCSVVAAVGKLLGACDLKQVVELASESTLLERPPPELTDFKDRRKMFVIQDQATLSLMTDDQLKALAAAQVQVTLNMATQPDAPRRQPIACAPVDWDDLPRDAVVVGLSQLPGEVLLKHRHVLHATAIAKEDPTAGEALCRRLVAGNAWVCDLPEEKSAAQTALAKLCESLTASWADSEAAGFVFPEDVLPAPADMYETRDFQQIMEDDRLENASPTEKRSAAVAPAMDSIASST